MSSLAFRCSTIILNSSIPSCTWSNSHRSPGTHRCIVGWRKRRDHECRCYLKGLQNVPPQQAIIDNTTRIAGKRDMARLLNIPVQFATVIFLFVFDTGANISVISETYAAKSTSKLLHTRFVVKCAPLPVCRLRLIWQWPNRWSWALLHPTMWCLWYFRTVPCLSEWRL